MIDTTLINIEDIKNVTSISDNVEVEQLQPFLFNAQTMYIRPIVGDALYNDMISTVESGGTGYTTLIENYIINALGYATWFSYIPFNHIKAQKKGLVLQSSDNSTNASMEEFAMYSQRVENVMTFYLQQLKDYLEKNKSLYPLYTSCDDSNQISSSSIFLGF